MFECLELDVRDGVAHLTLNRPDAANGIDLQLAQELLAASLLVVGDPTVRAVLLRAAGAGLSLVAASDVVVAGESAKFVMAYTGIGLTPDGSSSWFLPRLVGLRRALELTLTNRVLSAAEALDWGVVTMVVPDDQVESEAGSLVARLAAGPTRAFGRAKRLLQESLGSSLESHLAREAEAIVAAAATRDASEGLAALVGKRSPVFGGE